MHLDDIRKVLRHCYCRQAGIGPESAFRFALFMGPKRKHLFANYADPSNTQPGPSQPEQTRRKKKGKQREDPLQGLLPMDDLLEPPADPIETVSPNPNADGPSNHHPPSRDTSDPHTSAGAQQQDLVRIDMGQMLQLKEMGYDVILGPVNGPSEGYPEYEVPRAYLAALIAHSQSRSAPNPSAADIALGPSTSGSVPIAIDPALLCQANDTPHPPSTSHTPLQNTRPHVQSPIHSSTSMDRPTTTPNNDAGSAENSNETRERTPKKGRGKRAQANANLSPQTVRQTRNAKKKKKITDDDLAAMEAQNMVQSGTRRRTKSTRRKQ